MSTWQTIALGAVAGFTIFLGLPIGRMRNLDCRGDDAPERCGHGHPPLPGLGRPHPRDRAHRGCH